MTKTPVTYKETLRGILEIHEIEKAIMDSLVKVQQYVFRRYRALPIGEETVKCLHKLLASKLFAGAGTYRKHDVELGAYTPPPFYRVQEYMRNWEDDYKERHRHAKTRTQKIELCAWLIHRFLWIHPFFDYNGRISRLIGELYLLQSDLPVVSFRAIRRADFVKAVKKATQDSDLSLLVRLLEAEA